MKIVVLGAGAYGLALALGFYRNNNDVTVWTKVDSEKEELLTYRENKKGLSGVIIPNDIYITDDIDCVRDSDLVVLAISLPFLHSTCLELKDYVTPNMHFTIACKGIESNTNSFPHQVFTNVIKTENISILSGPTFAIDLANNNHSGLVVASNNDKTFEIIFNTLNSKYLKVVRSYDIIGIQLCGSIKNTIAIFAGMLDGISATETTKALFLTEAINELNNLIISFGGDSNTINSLAGIGDLLLTCTSTKSRNYSLGKIMATGNKDDINNYLNTNTVEGYNTLISIYEVIKYKNIHSPMIELFYDILFNNKNKKELLDFLTK